MDINDIPLATSPQEAAMLTSEGLDPEFQKTLIEIQKADAQKKIDKTRAPDGSILKLPEPKPLKLEYHFSGTCTCGKEPKTLLISNGTGTGNTVIAYCMSEDKQLLTLEVPLLPGTPPLAPPDIIKKK